MDEATRLRRRHQGLIDDASQTEPAAKEGNPTVLVQTVVKTTYPTAAGRVFAVKKVKITAAETEGAAPTLAAFGGIFYALNLGSTIPPAGTYLLATLGGGRWTMRYDG